MEIRSSVGKAVPKTGARKGHPEVTSGQNLELKELVVCKPSETKTNHKQMPSSQTVNPEGVMDQDLSSCVISYK